MSYKKTIFGIIIALLIFAAVIITESPAKLPTSNCTITHNGFGCISGTVIYINTYDENTTDVCYDKECNHTVFHHPLNQTPNSTTTVWYK